MACDCITLMDDKLKEHNSRLCVSFTFGKDHYTTPSIRTEKINPRNREVMGVIATFCPFCGERYEKAVAQ